MRKLVFAVGILVCSACGDDGEEEVGRLDAGPQDASLDAAPDASDAKPDASLDAGSCALDGSYRFYFSGGLVASTSVHTITAAGGYERATTRHERAGDAGTSLCMSTLPACGSAAVDLGDVAAALNASDVKSSFTTSESTVLGSDQRYVDGQVFVVERADGQRITVGYPCASEPGACKPIPEGVTALRTLLSKLADEQAASGPCKTN